MPLRNPPPCTPQHTHTHTQSHDLPSVKVRTLEDGGAEDYLLQAHASRSKWSRAASAPPGPVEGSGGTFEQNLKDALHNLPATPESHSRKAALGAPEPLGDGMKTPEETM